MSEEICAKLLTVPDVYVKTPWLRQAINLLRKPRRFAVRR